jgi:hypothetical protein
MISILIPVYKNHAYSLIAIKTSLFYKDYIDHIYIFDDCPSDPLINHDKKKLLNNEKIYYKVNEKTFGRINNYNSLLKACKSKFFLMLDGDDFLSDIIDFIEIMKQLKLNKDISMVVGHCEEVNLSTKNFLSIKGATRSGILEGNKLFVDWVGSKNLIPHSACIINTKSAKLLGGYSNALNNPEILLIRKLLISNIFVLSVNCTFSFWRKHHTNASLGFNFNSILNEFNTILICYQILNKKLFFTSFLWFMKSTSFYLTSAFHILFSKRSSFSRIIIFYKNFAIKFLPRSPLIIFSFLLTTPKILILFLASYILGYKNFKFLMIKRRNWLYD